MLQSLFAILHLPIDIWQMSISYLPGPMGFRLRYRFWKKRLHHLGKNVLIGTGVYFQNADFISIDDRCWIDNNVSILAGLDKSSREKIILENEYFNGEPGIVYIGKNVHIGAYSFISGISAGVYISNDCCLSTSCRVYAFSHHYRSEQDPSNDRTHFGSMASHDRQCLIEGPIVLGENTGVALGSIILPGVYVPKNCFIAINSVVKPGSYVENSIISGDPAQAIAKRFTVSE